MTGREYEEWSSDVRWGTLDVCIRLCIFDMKHRI